MQDWLTFIIVILILGVVLDGIRRMRAHRRETLRMSRAMPPDEEDCDEEEDLQSSEFPGGGPRVVGVRDTSDLANVNQNLRQNYAASKLTRGAPQRQADQGDARVGAPVPMLMDSVDDGRADHASAKRELSCEQEPVIGSLDNLEDDFYGDQQQAVPHGEQGRESAADDDDFFQSRPYQPVGEKPIQEEQLMERTEKAPAAPQEQPKAEAKPKAKGKKAKDKGAPKAEPEAEADELPHAAPDEVLVINVMARRGDMFAGPELLDAMLAQGLRFGDMDIFHRYESSDGRGKILFSVANMVVPGTFALEEMDGFESPGISMFLSLPIEGDSLAAYNLMAESAQDIAQRLGGELKDENRSVMTRQTIEHGRQRVLEYERKRRLAKV